MARTIAVHDSADSVRLYHKEDYSIQILPWYMLYYQQTGIELLLGFLGQYLPFPLHL